MFVKSDQRVPIKVLVTWEVLSLTNDKHNNVFLSVLLHSQYQALNASPKSPVHNMLLLQSYLFSISRRHFFECRVLLLLFSNELCKNTLKSSGKVTRTIAFQSVSEMLNLVNYRSDTIASKQLVLSPWKVT